MTSTPRPQPGIMDIELYVGGKSATKAHPDPVKLSSNENPHGPSPKAIEAYVAAAGQLHLYPNTDHAALRAAIGRVHGLDPERIICGVGSDEVLQWLCMAYAGEGDEVIHTEHGFLMYKIGARAVGATPVEVKEKDRVTDVDAILSAVTPRTRIVFIANPNNPTGTMIGANELARLAGGVPSDCLLVLDAAYAEFEAGYDGGISLVDRHPNVVMTRTFSKLYGLGGLRIGWGYAQKDVIDVLNRIRQPFNLSQMQMAAAIAAVEDREFADRCAADNARLRDWLVAELRKAGVAADTSHANFVLARFADAEEAAACDEWLQKDGLIVRHVASYALPHCLRITVGTEDACKRVAASVRAFKEARA